MKKISVLLCLSLSFNLVFAGEGDFKKKFQEAESYFTAETYKKALEIYLELLKEQPDNANLQFKTGLCYLNSDIHKAKAADYLEKAASKVTNNYDDGDHKETEAPQAVYRYLGQAYHYIYKFDQAIEMLQKYKLLIDPKADPEGYAEVDRLIYICNYAKEQVSAPVNMTVTNLGEKLNSPFPDYAAVVSADESTIIFTSRRPTNTGGKIDEGDGQYFEDIYISNKINDEWSAPVTIGPLINTEDHEASIALSVDGQTLFIYKDDKGDGNIYMSKLVGEIWSAPIKLLSDINSKDWEPSVCVSADGNVLYFVSDRKGGFGKRDIYFTKKLPDGSWGAAMNMGPVINTPGDEDSPFMHPDGKRLYFSSTGHKTIGGFDILVSELNDEGAWSVPSNMGYPINTTDDDVFYMPTANGKGAYYSSFREGGYGEKDIYYMSVPEQKEALLTVYKGTITDHYGRVPDGLSITVTDNNTGELVGTYIPNSKTGKYLFILPPGGNYNISYEAEGYLFQSENIDVSEDSAYQIINKPIQLADMKVGQKVILKNIFFASGKSELRPESKVELEKLLAVMNKNNKLIIEISGHTDSQGGEEFNQKLSEQRAQSVKKYLHDNGIEESRVKAVGYGESQPIAINTNPDGSYNKEGMAMNRRFEFKILSIDGNINEVEEIKVPERLKPKK